MVPTTKTQIIITANSLTIPTNPSTSLCTFTTGQLAKSVILQLDTKQHSLCYPSPSNTTVRSFTRRRRVWYVCKIERHPHIPPKLGEGLPTLLWGSIPLLHLLLPQCGVVGDVITSYPTSNLKSGPKAIEALSDTIYLY